MNWFKHDTTASVDSKVKKLLIAYGAEGYAVYFHCLELIASDINENHITFELEHDAEIIADNLKIKGTANQSGRDRVEEIMRKIINLNLFQEDHGRIFCYQLAKRLSSAQIKNQNLKKIQLLVEKQLAESSMKFLEDNGNVNTEEKEEKRKKEEKTASVEALSVSKLLIDEHRKIDPSFAVGKEDSRIKAWAFDIEKINRIDGRDWKVIESVMRWCKSDSFWAKNIMSGKTFREKFDRLFAGMPSAKPPEKQPYVPRINQEVAELKRQREQERTHD